mgnify:CR=1 FL=1
MRERREYGRVIEGEEIVRGWRLNKKERGRSAGAVGKIKERGMFGVG